VITPNATHQQTKMVVDPVEGTYQTVLTIDPSVGQSDIPGLYSCTVENARGRSSRAVVIPGNGKLIPCVHIVRTINNDVSITTLNWFLNPTSLSQYLLGLNMF